MRLPEARTDLLVQELKNDVLIYDLTNTKSYHLNSTVTAVFTACDGKTFFEDLKAETGLSDDLIHLSLDELSKNGLLSSQYVSPLAGMNRREAVRRIGLASMIALPVISAIIIPTAASAASTNTNCLPVNVCYGPGTRLCPPGCTGTQNITGYSSTNRSCTGFSFPDPINCDTGTTISSNSDFRRNS